MDGRKVLEKVKSLWSKEEPRRDVLAELGLRETDRPLIACIDASRLASASLGGITGELGRVDFFPDLFDVGGIRVKLVPHREGADNFTVPA